MIETVRSDDERYQYQLTYRWAEGPMLGWIMLNPSYGVKGIGRTGRACVNFALDWGYAGIVIRNRFAYRCTDPKDLMAVPDPHGVENHMFLRRALLEPVTVAAWGATKAVWFAKPLPSELRLMCIGMNLDGSPRHPLHAPGDAELMPW